MPVRAPRSPSPPAKSRPSLTASPVALRAPLATSRSAAADRGTPRRPPARTMTPSVPLWKTRSPRTTTRSQRTTTPRRRRRNRKARRNRSRIPTNHAPPRLLARPAEQPLARRRPGRAPPHEGPPQARRRADALLRKLPGAPPVHGGGTTMAEARRSDHADALPTDALKEAGQQLLSLVAQRATQAASDRVNDLTGRLTGITESGGTGVISALRGSSKTDGDDDRDDAESGDDGGERRSGIGGALGSLKDKVAGLFGGGGGGGGGKGKKLKVTVISENLDVGLPLRTTYNLWTQYEDFPSFMKKVETVDHDDEKSTWKAQVFWSHREWQATTVEQVPDSHIVWKSTGAKGHVDGAVTFTELGPNLTRVLLVMEYYPQGLFERTGNIWRAQGRRARLEFQHFRRHAMTDAILRPDEIEGWRGEIRDSEVVKTHEEALEEEQRQDDESAEDTAASEADERSDELDEDVDRDDEDELTSDAEDEDAYDDGAESTDEYEADEYDEPADDEPADEADEYDEPADEADEYDEYDDEPVADDSADQPVDQADDEEAESQQPSQNGGRRRREPVGARSGRRR